MRYQLLLQGLENQKITAFLMKNYLNTVTYLIKQIVELFHQLLLVALFRHIISRITQYLSYQEAQKSEEGSVIETNLCMKCVAASFL